MKSCCCQKLRSGLITHIIMLLLFFKELSMSTQNIIGIMLNTQPNFPPPIRPPKCHSGLCSVSMGQFLPGSLHAPPHPLLTVLQELLPKLVWEKIKAERQAVVGAVTHCSCSLSLRVPKSTLPPSHLSTYANPLMKSCLKVLVTFFVCTKLRIVRKTYKLIRVKFSAL